MCAPVHTVAHQCTVANCNAYLHLELSCPSSGCLCPAGDSAADHLNAFQRVYAVVSRAEVATFLLMAVMFGYGMGTIDSFMFIYLRELGMCQDLLKSVMCWPSPSIASSRGLMDSCLQQSPMTELQMSGLLADLRTTALLECPSHVLAPLCYAASCICSLHRSQGNGSW